jgi:hypothetical protein
VARHRSACGMETLNLGVAIPGDSEPLFDGRRYGHCSRAAQFAITSLMLGFAGFISVLCAPELLALSKVW